MAPSNNLSYDIKMKQICHTDIFYMLSDYFQNMV